MSKTKQPTQATAGIGDIIESLKVMRDAMSNLRSLPNEVEIARLRGSDPEALVRIVREGIEAYTLATTPERD